MRELSTWTSRPLLDVLALVIDFRGRTPKKLSMEWGDGEIPALSANNIEMGRINFSKECYLGSEELYRKWMTRGDARLGDVVLTTEAPLGNVAQIPDSQRYIMSQRAILLRANDEYLWNDYLAHYLRSECFQNLMRQQSSGTTATGIQRKKLETLSIRFPSDKFEQSKIVEVLSTVDRAIEQTEALIAKQERIKTGLMQDLLTRGIDEHGNLRSESTHEFKDSPLGRIPVEWEVVPLSAVADLQVGYAFKSAWFVDDGMRLLRGENVGAGRPDWKDTKYLPLSMIGNYGEYVLASGDLIIGMDRTFTKQGVKVSLLSDHDTPCLLVQRVGRFIPLGIPHAFMSLTIQSPLYQRNLFLQQKGMDIPHLSKTEILTPLVPVPGKQVEMETIAVRVEVLQDTARDSIRLLTKLRALKTALMQDLLTGKKRVTPLLELQPIR
jgi:type I restriction enzyme S subunit